MATNTGTAVGYSYQNITGQATATLRSGTGILHSIVFNKPVATATIVIYDNTSAAGTKIASITVPANPLPVVLVFDVAYTTGLTVVTGVADEDITVTYI